MRHAVRRLRGVVFVGIVASCTVLSGCSSSSPGGGGGGGGGGTDPVAASLNKLGVDTTPTKRKSPTGGDLPSGFAPLGTSSAYGDPPDYSNNTAAHATDAVLLVGPTLPSDSQKLYPSNLMKITGASVTGSTPTYGTASAMQNFDTATYPWAAPSGAAGIDPTVQSLRSVATGDLDGDGLQELVAAYVVPPAGAGADPTLKIDIIQDSKESYARTTYTIGDALDITDVSVVTGDFNGDGTSQIAIATAYADHGSLLFLKGASANYQVDASATKTFTPSISGSAMYFRLASGNLDYDRSDELAVVVDEFASGPTGAAAYHVFDDASTGFKELKSGTVQGSDGGVHVALAGDISLGDIDGDGVNEVVMGGPTNFADQCNSGYGQIVTALDDAAHTFATLGSIYEPQAAFSNCGNYAYNPWKVYFTFVNTLDLTGSGVYTIAANQFLYDYLPSSSTCTTGLCPRTDSGGTVMRLPDASYIAGDAGVTLSPTHASVAVGDVTADGRQNLLVDVQWHPEVQVWGQSQVSAVGVDGWAQLSSIPTDYYNDQANVRPILVPTQTEPGGPVLKYSDGSYKLVFTQPIVIAALAAAPCQQSIDQNVSACVTTFGQGTSSGGGTSVSVSVTAGVTVGVEEEAAVPFVGTFKAQEKASISATATATVAHSYNVTKTVTYATGSMQDGVIFTTVPYDQYTYTIVSAADPNLVGKLVVVSLPRTPITLIAERSFYNAAVPDGALKIDARVFQHTVGDVASYPSASQEASLMTQYGGIDNGPKTVGEGTGSTQLSIAVSNEISQTGTLAMQYDYSFETSGEGFVFGFNVGYGASASLTVTSGTSTTYTGTVGSISPTDFAANYYDFGLFTYVQPIDGQKIEVVNYWTTPH